MSFEAVPAFLELKRLVPRMRREHPGFRAALDDLARATCFVLPDRKLVFTADIANAALDTYRAGQSILPTAPCLFEINLSGSRLVLLCHQDEPQPDAWGVLVWMRHAQRGWGPWRYGLQLLLKEVTLEVFDVHSGEPPSQEEVDRHATWIGAVAQATVIAAYLCTAGCGLFETRQVSRTNRALMQAKGLRGWQYKLVTLDPDRVLPPRAEHGGTHASPRWHLRRAHVRRLRDGRVVTVRSCEVGSAEHGGIVKDYELVPPA